MCLRDMAMPDGVGPAGVGVAFRCSCAVRSFLCVVCHFVESLSHFVFSCRPGTGPAATGGYLLMHTCAAAVVTLTFSAMHRLVSCLLVYACVYLCVCLYVPIYVHACVLCACC